MKAIWKLGLACAALTVVTAPTLAQDAPAENAQWKAPRTPWGDPDLRGAYPLDYLNGTPRTRSPQFGTRAEYTDEEYAELLKNA
jgi:hypothetical protein